MKTAGQLFLEWYNSYVNKNGCSPSDYDVNFYWSGGNLETEKQQIIDAYQTCCNCEGTPFNGEDYFNDTFNTTNKETLK